MLLCEKCGTKVDEGTKFCPSCGNSMEVPAPQQQEQNSGDSNDFSAKIANLNDTADTTADYDADDVSKNKAMAVLAYFGPLCFIPMFAAKDSKFARFHANQGLVLLIACVAYSIVSSILNSIILAISWRLYFITSIISFISVVFAVLAILGIINAANGRAKELPVIGKFKILK